MRIKKFLLIALSVFLLVGCSGNQSNDGGDTDSSSGDTIKLGLIAPLTGEVSIYGKEVLKGVELAVEEYNSKGGVLDKKIEIIEYDDKGDNNEALNVYRKLTANDKVDAIIGGVISTNTLAIVPQAAKDGIPLITPTATAEEITAAGENIYRSCYTDPFQGGIMAKFALEDLGAKKAAIIYDQEGDYGTGLGKAFEKVFTEGGGEIVSNKGFNPKDKDYKSILTEIKSSNPEVIFVPGYYNEVALIGKQAKEIGIEATLLGGDGWDGVVEIDKESVLGGYFSNHYAADDEREIVQNFVKNYEEKNNGEKPKSFAALGYDATVTMLEAMKAAEATDKDKVVEKLKATNLELVSGETTFDENRNPIKKVSILKVVEDGYELSTKK